MTGVQLTAASQNDVLNSLVDMLDAGVSVPRVQVSTVSGDYSAGNLVANAALNNPEAFGDAGAVVNGVSSMNEVPSPSSLATNAGVPQEFQFIDGDGVWVWRGNASPGGELSGPSSIGVNDLCTFTNYELVFPATDTLLPMGVGATTGVGTPRAVPVKSPDAVAVSASVGQPTIIASGAGATVGPSSVGVTTGIGQPTVSTSGPPVVITPSGVAATTGTGVLSVGQVTVNFEQDDGSRSITPPTGRMAPAPLVADVWSESRGDMLSGAATIDIDDQRRHYTKTTWDFGDPGSLIVNDPDPTSHRLATADLSYEQMGFVAGMIYLTDGSYQVSASCFNGDGTDVATPYSGTYQVEPDTRAVRYVDAVDGVDDGPSGGTGTGTSAWRTLAFANVHAPDDCWIYLEGGQTHVTVGTVTISGSNKIVRSRPGSGIAVVEHQQNSAMLVLAGNLIALYEIELQVNATNAEYGITSGDNDSIAVTFAESATNCWTLDLRINGSDSAPTNSAFWRAIDLPDDDTWSGYTNTGTLMVRTLGDRTSLNADTICANAYLVHIQSTTRNFVNLAPRLGNSEHEWQTRMLRSNSGADVAGEWITWRNRGITYGFVYAASPNVPATSNMKPFRFQHCKDVTVYRSHIRNVQMGYKGGLAEDVILDAVFTQQIDGTTPYPVPISFARNSRRVMIRNFIAEWYHSTTAGANAPFMGGANTILNQEAIQFTNEANDVCWFNGVFVFRDDNTGWWSNRWFSFWFNDNEGTPATVLQERSRMRNCWMVISDQGQTATANDMILSHQSPGEQMAELRDNSFPDRLTHAGVDDWWVDAGPLESPGGSTFTTLASVETDINNAGGDAQNNGEETIASAAGVIANDYEPLSSQDAYDRGRPADGVHHDYGLRDRNRNSPTWPAGAVDSSLENDFDILFIDDDGNATTSVPTHMAPVPYTVTIVRDDNTLTPNFGSSRLTKSGIFWDFGDTTNPYFVRDPDARVTGVRTGIWGDEANLSERQYGTTAAYSYRQGGTYTITCRIVLEDGSELRSQVDVVVPPDTRTVVGTVGVDFVNLAAGIAALGDNEVLEIARGYSETLECPSLIGDTYAALLTQTNSLVRAAAGSGAAPELRMSYRAVGGGTFRCFGFSATARRTGVIGMQIVPDNNDLSFFYEGGGQPGSMSGFEFADSTCVNCWHADTVFGGTADTAAPGTGADYGCLTGFTVWGDRATACHEINQTVLPGEGYILRYAHVQRQQARHCLITGSECQGSAQEHLQRYLGDSQPIQHTSCWTHFADWQFDWDPSPQATKGYRFQSALYCGFTQSFLGSQIEFGFDGYNADDCQAVACYLAGMGNQSAVNFGGDNIRTSIRDCIVSQEQRYEPDGGFNLTPFDPGANGVFDYQGESSELYVGQVSFISLGGAGGGRTPPYTFQGSALVNVPSNPYEFRNIYHAVDDLNTQYMLRAYGLDVSGRWLWEHCAFPVDSLVRSDGYENDGGPSGGGWRRPFSTFQPTVDPSLTCTQVNDTGTDFIARGYQPLPSASLDEFCPVTDGHQKDYRWVDRDRNAAGWQPGAVGLELTATEAGWTDPASGATFYVSSVLGDDSYNGLSETYVGGVTGPKATLAAGVALLTSGQNDSLLLRRGDSWNEQLVLNNLSGADADGPMTIGTYGNYLFDRPTIGSVGGTNHGIVATGTCNHLQILGIACDNGVSYDGTLGDAYGISISSISDNLLIEDCLTANFSRGIYITPSTSNTTRVTIRRNVVYDNWRESGFGAGIYAGSNAIDSTIVDGLLIEENIVDRNGWSASQVLFTEANRTASHNIYVAPETLRIRTRANYTLRSSQAGITQPDGDIFDNFAEGNPIGIRAGQFDNGLEGGMPWVERNVVSGAVGTPGFEVTAPSGDGILVAGVQASRVYSNIVKDSQVTVPSNGAISCDASQGDLGAHRFYVSDNDVYDFPQPLRFLAPGGNSYSYLRVQDNYFNVVSAHGTTEQNVAMYFGQSDFTVLDVRRNEYTSPNASSQYFYADGAVRDSTYWGTNSSEILPVYSGTPRTYTDATRTLAEYVDSVNGTSGSTLDDACNVLRARRRGFWSDALRTYKAVNYVREGFDKYPVPNDDGWTDYPVSATTYYVASNGSNGNTGLTEADPFQTINHAIGLLGAGGQDVSILLRYGDTFDEQIFNPGYGAAPQSPLVFGAYGDSSLGRPQIQPSGLLDQCITINQEARNLWFLDLDLGHDPGSFVGYDGPSDNNNTNGIETDWATGESGDNFLVEGCYIHHNNGGLGLNLTGGGGGGTAGTKNLRVRRNVIGENWKDGNEDSHGCFIGGVAGSLTWETARTIANPIVEENYIFQNGVHPTYYPTPSTRSQGVYFQGYNDLAMYRDNVNWQGANSGIQQRCGGWNLGNMHMFLALGASIGVDRGGDNTPVNDTRRFRYGIVRNLASIEGRDLSPFVSSPGRGTAVLMGNVLGGVVEDNLVGPVVTTAPGHAAFSLDCDVNGLQDPDLGIRGVLVRRNRTWGSARPIAMGSSIAGNDPTGDSDVPETGVRWRDVTITDNDLSLGTLVTGNPRRNQAVEWSYGGDTTPVNVTFGSNRYQTSNAIDDAFEHYSAGQQLSLSQWETATGDTGSTLTTTPPSYTDTTRTMRSHVDQVENTTGTTNEGILALVVQHQRRGSWRTDLESMAFINHLREGFDLPLLR